MTKYILASIILFLIPLSVDNVSKQPDAVSEFKLLHINAKWNQKNNVNLGSIQGCQVQYALLEDQPAFLQKKINYVPVLLLFKKDTPVVQWSADLSFKLNVNKQEIIQAIELNK